MFTIKHRRKFAALLATGATAVALTAGAGAAGAERQPIGATGNTVFQFNAQFVKALQNNGCGPLSAMPTGNATLSSTNAGKAKVTLPVTGVAVSEDSFALRIEHSGSGVELSNSCYDIRLTNIYIQNFGDANQFMTMDVSAKTQTDDGTDRTEVFTIDLSNANLTITDHGAVKVRSANVLLGSDGVDEFNQLVTGTTTGPFTEGEQVGKARTTVRLQYV